MIEFANESLSHLENTSEEDISIQQSISNKNNSSDDNESFDHSPQNNEYELNPDNNDEYEYDISDQSQMKTS